MHKNFFKKAVALVTSNVIIISSSLSIFANTPPVNSINNLSKLSVENSKGTGTHGGEVYRTWYGPDEVIDIGATINAENIALAIVAQIAGIPWYMALAIGTAISSSSQGVNYLKVKRKYQEIYVGGEFAYFRTTLYTYPYYDKNCTISAGPCIEEVFEGNSLLNISEN